VEGGVELAVLVEEGLLVWLTVALDDGVSELVLVPVVVRVLLAVTVAVHDCDDVKVGDVEGVIVLDSVAVSDCVLGPVTLELDVAVVDVVRLAVTVVDGEELAVFVQDWLLV
jgi:hypothetical protein